jgi:superfamily II DNA/RNA helicase
VVLNQVEYVVLDEADRMLDIGFLPDLQRILSYLPKQRITLLFSATFSPEIKRLASSYLQDPVTIEVSRPNAEASTVEQHFFSVPDDDKRRALRQVVRQRGLTQAFVFVNSKLGCAVGALAGARGHQTTALLATRGGRALKKALEAFKKGEVDACWWPPTSPPAAWTSRTGRRCSTSTCRSTPRTTSTASAVPAAPALPAWR